MQTAIITVRSSLLQSMTNEAHYVAIDEDGIPYLTTDKTRAAEVTKERFLEILEKENAQVSEWTWEGDRFANTAREFPDFDLATMPEIPADYVDVSWHNDSCPSFLNEATGRILFVDYADAENREHPETPRFNLNVWDCGNTGETLVESDDWNAILVQAIDVSDESTAKAFLTALHGAGLAYHPDDSADDCLSSHGLSVAQLSHIQACVTNSFSFVDPSAVLLDLINAN